MTSPVRKKHQKAAACTHLWGFFVLHKLHSCTTRDNLNWNCQSCNTEETSDHKSACSNNITLLTLDSQDSSVKDPTSGQRGGDPISEAGQIAPRKRRQIRKTWIFGSYLEKLLGKDANTVVEGSPSSALGSPAESPYLPPALQLSLDTGRVGYR